MGSWQGRSRPKAVTAGSASRAVLFLALWLSLWHGSVSAEPSEKERAIAALQRGDFAPSLAVFIPLAERGDPFAQFIVGQLHERGSGVPQNPREAARWYARAAQAGQAEAMNNLGFLYEQGTGVPQDYQEAMRLYKRAAEAGNAVAASNLANAYLEGRLVARDDPEAARWFERGARLDDPVAQFNLGRMYDIGRGVAIDVKQACHWYQQAAELGSPAAQLNAGICHAEGRGARADLIEAHKWFNLASAGAEDENLRRNAMRNRDLLSARMKPGEIENAQTAARTWTPKVRDPRAAELIAPR